MAKDFKSLNDGPTLEPRESRTKPKGPRKDKEAIWTGRSGVVRGIRGGFSKIPITTTSTAASVSKRKPLSKKPPTMRTKNLTNPTPKNPNTTGTMSHTPRNNNKQLNHPDQNKEGSRENEDVNDGQGGQSNGDGGIVVNKDTKSTAKPKTTSSRKTKGSDEQKTQTPRRQHPSASTSFPKPISNVSTSTPTVRKIDIDQGKSKPQSKSQKTSRKPGWIGWVEISDESEDEEVEAEEDIDLEGTRRTRSSTRSRRAVSTSKETGKGKAKGKGKRTVESGKDDGGDDETPVKGKGNGQRNEYEGPGRENLEDDENVSLKVSKKNLDSTVNGKGKDKEKEKKGQRMEKNEMVVEIVDGYGYGNEKDMKAKGQKGKAQEVEYDDQNGDKNILARSFSNKKRKRPSSISSLSSLSTPSNCDPGPDPDPNPTATALARDPPVVEEAGNQDADLALSLPGDSGKRVQTTSSGFKMKNNQSSKPKGGRSAEKGGGQGRGGGRPKKSEIKPERWKMFSSKRKRLRNEEEKRDDVANRVEQGTRSEHANWRKEQPENAVQEDVNTLGKKAAARDRSEKGNAVADDNRNEDVGEEEQTLKINELLSKNDSPTTGEREPVDLVEGKNIGGSTEDNGPRRKREDDEGDGDGVEGSEGLARVKRKKPNLKTKARCIDINKDQDVGAESRRQINRKGTQGKEATSQNGYEEVRDDLETREERQKTHPGQQTFSSQAARYDAQKISQHPTPSDFSPPSSSSSSPQADFSTHIASSSKPPPNTASSQARPSHQSNFDHLALQIYACTNRAYDGLNLSRCASCAGKKKSGQSCLFKGVRSLWHDQKGKLIQREGREPQILSNLDPDDEPIFPTSYSFNRTLSPKDLNSISFASATFLQKVLEREHDILLSFSPSQIKKRRKEIDSRFICDQCLAGIFAIFWQCQRCGISFCEGCFAELGGWEDVERGEVENEREGGWPKGRGENMNFDAEAAGEPPEMKSVELRTQRLRRCSGVSFKKARKRGKEHDEDREMTDEHSGNHLQLWTFFTDDELEQLIHEIHEILEAYCDGASTQAPLANYAELSSLCPGVTLYTEAGNPTSHPFYIVDSPAHLSLPAFDVIWNGSNDTSTYISNPCSSQSSSQHPLLVKNILYDAKIWNPRWFQQKYGTNKCKIVDCETEEETEGIVSDFLKVFGKKRSTNVGVMKLKDWPPQSDFKITCPELYNDFIKMVPCPDVTRRDGVANIAAFAPWNAIRPDLGPKIYSAYKSRNKPGGHGSTRLHMDVADAVNILVYGETHDTKEPTAVWHIFRAEDRIKIRDFLYDVSYQSLPSNSRLAKSKTQFVAESDDPILEQQSYLDSSLLQRLETEYLVKPYTIVQHVGDAIFIPAGSPHQVLNNADCIKIAQDFVSIRNLEKCQELTTLFRQQTKEKLWCYDVVRPSWMALWALKTSQSLYPHISLESATLACATTPAVETPSSPPAQISKGTSTNQSEDKIDEAAPKSALTLLSDASQHTEKDEPVLACGPLGTETVQVGNTSITVPLSQMLSRIHEEEEEDMSANEVFCRPSSRVRSSPPFEEAIAPFGTTSPSISTREPYALMPSLDATPPLPLEHDIEPGVMRSLQNTPVDWKATSAVLHDDEITLTSGFSRRELGGSTEVDDEGPPKQAGTQLSSPSSARLTLDALHLHDTVIPHAMFLSSKRGPQLPSTSSISGREQEDNVASSIGEGGSFSSMQGSRNGSGAVPETFGVNDLARDEQGRLTSNGVLNALTHQNHESVNWGQRKDVSDRQQRSGPIRNLQMNQRSPAEQWNRRRFHPSLDRHPSPLANGGPLPFQHDQYLKSSDTLPHHRDHAYDEPKSSGQMHPTAETPRQGPSKSSSSPFSSSRRRGPIGSRTYFPEGQSLSPFRSPSPDRNQDRPPYLPSRERNGQRQDDQIRQYSGGHGKLDNDYRDQRWPPRRSKESHDRQPSRASRQGGEDSNHRPRPPFPPQVSSSLPPQRSPVFFQQRDRGQAFRGRGRNFNHRQPYRYHPNHSSYGDSRFQAHPNPHAERDTRYRFPPSKTGGNAQERMHREVDTEVQDIGSKQSLGSSGMYT